MEKISLSGLFWILVAFSLTLAGLSLSTLSPQILVLSHFTCVLVLSTVYAIKSRKQKDNVETQSKKKQEEINSLHEHNRDTMVSILSSIQALVTNSERSTSDVENLNNLVQTTSENAKQAALLSHQSRTTVESSVKAISELYRSMNEVSQSSKKITDILSLIEDIAFQTNLLALNAAVEAARAGEQGKGFAVVAEAVRNLAQKSSSAAKDISALIQETTTNIKKGCNQAQNSQQLLNSLLSGSLKVSDINNEISLSSQEQATSTKNLRSLLTELVTSQQDIIKQIQSGATGTETVTSIRKIEKLKADTTTDFRPMAVNPPKFVTVPKAKHRPHPAIETKPKSTAKKLTLEPSLTSQPKTSKTPQELIPFDEDEDRLTLTKASDF